MTPEERREKRRADWLRPSTTPYDEDDPVYALHLGGKLETLSTAPLRNRDDLSLAYTPGVARVCTTIAEHPDTVWDLTWKSHVVAVVTDGSAVLGLGDIGPAASLPVMEGKAVLFKEFGGIDAVPICLDARSVEDIVETVVRLAPAFGGINLEDISAPRCFEIERLLQERLDIPVFHDDQHGTAVVVLAALRNAALLTGRSLGDLRAVVSGAGAAGVAVTTILREAGIGDISVADRGGVLHGGREDLTSVKSQLASETNEGGHTGSLVQALRGADVFIGVSGGSVPEEAIAAMADDSIVFALANPHPEVHPEVAGRHARVVATGRSDYPNQINNVLAFPGIFRGALAVRASSVTEGMKLAAAEALAAVVADELSRGPGGPEPVRPPGRAGGGGRGVGRRPPGRRRPALTWLRGLTRAAAASRASPGGPAGRGAGPSAGRRAGCRVLAVRIASRSPSSSRTTRCIASGNTIHRDSREVKMYREFPLLDPLRPVPGPPACRKRSRFRDHLYSTAVNSPRSTTNDHGTVIILGRAGGSGSGGGVGADGAAQPPGRPAPRRAVPGRAGQVGGGPRPVGVPQQVLDVGLREGSGQGRRVGAEGAGHGVLLVLATPRFGACIQSRSEAPTSTSGRCPGLPGPGP